MADLEIARAAVDLPPARIVPQRPAPGHRALTGGSGIVLFACMFLPAVKGCHEAVMPFEVPPFLPPYGYGLVFALIAVSRTPRGLWLGVVALRALGALMVVSSIVLALLAPPVAIVELIVGAVLLVTAGLTGATEPGIAATGVAVGVVSVLWFGCWSATPDALIGVYLSLAGSLGLLVGCAAWWREAVGRLRAAVPRAVPAAAHRQAPG